MKEMKRLQDRLVEKQGTAVFVLRQRLGYMQQPLFIIGRGYPMEAHCSTGKPVDEDCGWYEDRCDAQGWRALSAGLMCVCALDQASTSCCQEFRMCG